MKGLLKAILLVPIAVVAVAFAVANRQVVSISFDPFSPAEPAFALVAPLFLLIFILLMVGVVIGGIASWLGQARYRRAARHAQAEAGELRAENERLKTELTIQARQAQDSSRTRLPALAAYDA